MLDPAQQLIILWMFAWLILGGIGNGVIFQRLLREYGDDIDYVVALFTCAWVRGGGPKARRLRWWLLVSYVVWFAGLFFWAWLSKKAQA